VSAGPIPELKVAAEVSSFEGNNCLAEEIVKFDGNRALPAFAVWDGQVVRYSQTLPGPEENSCYTPICDDAVTKKAVKLPEAAADYSSEAQLLEEIRAHIRKYIDVSPWFEEVAANYVLLTWIYDVLPTVPYLRALGDTGTGKSRFLNVVGGLCYKPVFANGAITPAPIYRMLKSWPGTLIIDEGDWKESDEYQEIVKILNAGFEKDRPVLRCVKDDPDKVQVLNVYGPKIIGTRREFFDQALESRCLTETMSMTKRADIPVLLLEDFEKEQLGLRNKLLMFRFRVRPRIKIDLGIAEKLGDIEPRLKQATVSFTVLFANIPELFKRFKEFLLGYQKELIEKRSTTYEGMIVKALFLLAIEEGVEVITSSSISEKVKEEHGVEISAPKVGRILAVLKVKVDPKTIDGRTRRIVTSSKEEITSLSKRYVPDIENYSNYGNYSTYGYCQHNNNDILSYGDKVKEEKQADIVCAVESVIAVIDQPAPVQAPAPGISSAEDGSIGFLIKAVARQPSGLGRPWVIGLIRDCYPKEDPEAILQKFCDHGIFLEAGGRVMKA